MSSFQTAASTARPALEYWAQPQKCCDREWEAAYLRFETGDEERAKFLGRLRGFGAQHWPHDSRIVELCCGRGSGLAAWRELGFPHLEGVDLSVSLLAKCPDAARLYVGDCRQLKLPDASRDIVAVQGGLHHLARLPEDVRATAAEAWRVLRPGGKFLVVEPWTTPFLRCTHALCAQPAARRLSPRLAALAAMIEREAVTYHAWLAQPEAIWAALTAGFITARKRIAWGKLHWLGLKPAADHPR